LALTACLAGSIGAFWWFRSGRGDRLVTERKAEFGTASNQDAVVVTGAHGHLVATAASDNLRSQGARSGPEDFLASLLVGSRGRPASEFADLVANESLATLKELLEDPQVAGGLPERAIQAMLTRLAGEDAPWTSKYVTGMPAGPWRSELVAVMLARWGTEDLPAAIEWAEQLADRSLQQSALIHLSYRWFETDPKEALMFAALHSEGQAQLLTNLLAQWVRQSPEVATSWAVGLMDESGRADIATSAVAAWAEQDEVAAAEFVLRLPEGELRAAAVTTVISALARKSPQDGASWIRALPSGPGKNAAIEHLAYQWAAWEPAAVLAWADRLPAQERDAAIYAGAGGLAEERPAVAAVWTLSIRDEAMRYRQAERISRRWLETDRWTAEAWIRQSGLPATAQARLLGLPVAVPADAGVQ
jgi:hypothetical protein